MFKRLLRGLIEFLYPKSDTVYSLESLSPSDLLAKLAPAQIDEENILALFSYQDELVRQLVWELKYRRNEKIVESLASIVYDSLRAEIAEKALFDATWRGKIFLLPVPMHPKRRRERGWNQTEVLAEAVKKLDIENLFEYEPRVLEKSVYTESQTLMKEARKRKSNIENSMKIKEGVNLKGARVVVLDDVTTTGATLGDARRALREAGARRILCVAIAH